MPVMRPQARRNPDFIFWPLAGMVLAAAIFLAAAWFIAVAVWLVLS